MRPAASEARLPDAFAAQSNRHHHAGRGSPCHRRDCPALQCLDHRGRDLRIADRGTITSRSPIWRRSGHSILAACRNPSPQACAAAGSPALLTLPHVSSLPTRWSRGGMPFLMAELGAQIVNSRRGRRDPCQGPDGSDGARGDRPVSLRRHGFHLAAPCRHSCG